MGFERKFVDHFLFSGLIAQAERTLARSKKAGYQGRASIEMEELLGKLYDKRRVVMEDMMQMPPRQAGLYDA